MVGVLLSQACSYQAPLSQAQIDNEASELVIYLDFALKRRTHLGGLFPRYHAKADDDYIILSTIDVLSVLTRCLRKTYSLVLHTTSLFTYTQPCPQTAAPNVPSTSRPRGPITFFKSGNSFFQTLLSKVNPHLSRRFGH